MNKLYTISSNKSLDFLNLPFMIGVTTLDVKICWGGGCTGIDLICWTAVVVVGAATITDCCCCGCWTGLFDDVTNGGIVADFGGTGAGWGISYFWI